MTLNTALKFTTTTTAPSIPRHPPPCIPLSPPLLYPR